MIRPASEANWPGSSGLPLGSVKVWDWMWDFDFAVLITNWKIKDMFHSMVPRGGIEPPTP